MKKLIAMLLALVLVMGLVACGNTETPATTPAATEPADTTAEPTEPVEDTIGAEEMPVDTEAPVEIPEPNEATQVLTTITEAIEGDQFIAFGGNPAAMVEGAPGNYDLTDEGLATTLYVPADQVANLTCASAAMHMLANNFTGALYQMADGADIAAFADAMKEAIGSAQWMCGMPETMLIATVENEFVLVAFGLDVNVKALETAMLSVYAGAEILYSEPIAR